MCSHPCSLYDLEFILSDTTSKVTQSTAGHSRDQQHEWKLREAEKNGVIEEQIEQQEWRLQDTEQNGIQEEQMEQPDWRLRDVENRGMLEKEVEQQEWRLRDSEKRGILEEQVEQISHCKRIVTPSLFIAQIFYFFTILSLTRTLHCIKTTQAYAQM